MRIAVISDIHANLPALEAVWADIQENLLTSDDQVWFLGDLFGYGPFTTQVYTKLKQNVCPKIWLVGNHDLAVGGENSCLEKMNELAHRVAKIHAQTIPKVILDDVIQKPEQRILPNISGWSFHLAHGFPYQSNNRSILEITLKKIQQIIRMFSDNEHVLAHGEDTDRIISVNTYDFEAAPSGEKPLLIQSARKRSPNTQVWIVGHSHRQTGWYYRAEKKTWRLLTADFGQNLSGKVRRMHNKTQSETWKFFVQSAYVQQGDFIIINPGSVGFPRDGRCSLDEPLQLTKYLLLNVTEESIVGEYRWVPYSGKTLLTTWENSPRYPVEVQNFIRC